MNVTSVRAGRRRLPGDDERRRDRLPRRGHRERRLQPAVGAGAVRRRCRAEVEQLTPFDYRGPGQLPDGGVLVVGASATGVQLAAEISAVRPAGDPVRRGARAAAAACTAAATCCGGWTPRACGTSATTRSTTSPGPGGCRRRSSSGLPSGRPSTSTRSPRLASSSWAGSAMVRDGSALFSGGLRNVFSLADLKMNRLLDTFDEWALTSGRDAEFGAPERFAPTGAPASPRLAARPAERRDPAGRVGDRLPARLRLARRARGRREGPAAPRGRRGRRSPGCTRSACRCCGGASQRSSTASRTTPAR